jgi:phospholipase/carboxylesterase
MQLPIEWLPAEGRAEQLILLLHGWGSSGADLAPLAQALRVQFPQAAVLAPDAPTLYEGDAERAAERAVGQAAERADEVAAERADDRSAGPAPDGPAAAATAATAVTAARRPPRRQWYAVRDLTPEIWPARVAACLPGLQAWVRAQQQRLGVAPAATCLGGFSQGAILSLALAVQHDGLAGRVLAFAGCFTAPPAAAPEHTTLHLFHGADDTVIPADGSRQALAWLAERGGDATLDVAQGVGHELHAALVQCALQRLQSHIPARTWRAAVGAAAALQAAADEAAAPLPPP